MRLRFESVTTGQRHVTPSRPTHTHTHTHTRARTQTRTGRKRLGVGAARKVRADARELAPAVVGPHVGAKEVVQLGDAVAVGAVPVCLFVCLWWVCLGAREC